MEIRLEKFCKSFGSVKVIEDLDLIINNGFYIYFVFSYLWITHHCVQ